MKKFALLVLAALMVMTMLVACGGDSNQPSASPTEKRAIKPPAGGFGDHTVTTDGISGYDLPSEDAGAEATPDVSVSPKASAAG